MHPRILSQRDEQAQASIRKSATRLAKQFGAPDLLEVKERDRQSRLMLEREEVARLLSDIADAAEAQARTLAEELQQRKDREEAEAEAKAKDR